MTEITDRRVTQLMPRGTDRVRRRQQQADAVVQADKEILLLVSPTTDAKLAQIEQNRATDLAEFGATKRSRKLVEQARHRAEAEAEGVIVSERVPKILAVLRPGQQVDHVTARRFMKANTKQINEKAMVVAKAAGQTVLSMLRGKDDAPGKVTRHRKVARHAARQAQAKKKA